MFPNNLLTRVAQNRICTALGVKLVVGPEIVHISKSAGYDSLFIDLEHSTLSLGDTGKLCINALSAGVTPFVRVPHQCGNGFVQRVLDAGGMGVIFPHIHNLADVRDAVKISKYPPLGKRSLTAALPQFEFALTPASTITTEVNKSGSTVFLMVETEECLRNIDEIASEPGVDVLLVGSNDLAIELDTLGNWDDPRFIEALETVGCAAKKHGKIFGIAGLYHRPDILSRVVNEMGARYVLGGLDIGMITSAACQNLKLLRSIQGSSPNLPRQSSD